MSTYENPPRHTAKQVADDVAAGMDPDVELVPAQYYDRLEADLNAVREAVKTGFTFQEVAQRVFEILWPDTGAPEPSAGGAQ